MPAIDLSILNQRQTPAFYADTLANRPSAGFIGRIFVSTDTFAFYRDNGTTWDLIGGPGTGTITGSGANGQVSYWNGASTITGSNDLFFDAVNGHLGVGTVTPGTALDVKHNQNTVVQLEQETATNDTRIAFINSGVGLWRLGAFYNAGANDFGIYDVVGAIQQFTIKKTTGQTLIGGGTGGSGKLVVESGASDNGIQIVGTLAPSLRIDNANTGPTKRIGLGIATNTNNFIQGSADRDMCIFNGSTTASPILFGIYDAAAVNVQEAARISAARNFLIGTTTDSGQKLLVNGTSRFQGFAFVNHSTASSYGAAIYNTNVNGEGLAIRGGSTSSHSSLIVQNYDGSTLLFNVLANGNVGIGTTNGDIFSTANATNILGVQATGTNQGGLIDISATGTGFSGVNMGTTSIRRGGIYTLNGSDLAFYTNPTNTGTGLTERARITSAGRLGIGQTVPGTALSVAGQSELWQIALTYVTGTSGALIGSPSANVLAFGDWGGTERMRITSSGNLLIGTTTDAGQKLQVQGSSYFNNYIIANTTIGKNGQSGTIANNSTVTINPNGFGGVFSVGFIACTASVSQGSFNSVILISQIHTNNNNIYTTLSNQNDSAGMTITLVGMTIVIANTSGFEGKYNCRYINFADYETWLNGV